MSLCHERMGRIGSIALFALLACSESQPTPSMGSGGSAGAPASGGAGSPSMSGSGGASGAAGNNASGGSAGKAGGAGASTGGASGGGGSGGGAGGGGSGGSAGSGGSGGAKSKTTFFVTSDTSMTGKLGGLEGADMRCNSLAKAAGIGDHTFKAYLCTSTESAKDRIGMGPWVNALGVTVAADSAALHALKGNADLFVDEKGMKINGQWNSSSMNEHDILTGCMADGTVLAGKTCMDWTSDSASMAAQVGHSDGMGPGMDTSGTYSSWNASHENGGCADTQPRGGAGRIYCFAVD